MACVDIADGAGCLSWVGLDQSPGSLVHHFALLEGALTCVVAFALFFVISDFPEEVKWLTSAERDFVETRLREDVGSSQRYRPLTVEAVLRTIKDCTLPSVVCRSRNHGLFAGKILLGGLMYLGMIVPAYGYGRDSLQRRFSQC